MIRSFVIGALLCAALRSTGCDVCGIFLNVQPNDRSTQFGLLYRSRMLSRDFGAEGLTLLKHGGTVEANEPRQVREMIQAVEARADVRFAEKWAVLAAVPLVNTYQSVNDYMRYDAYGLGDPFALVRYQLLNTKCTAPDSVNRPIHRLQIGAGVKAPIGRSDVEYEGERLHPDAQPGTGSWDALVSIEYAVRARRNGVLFTSLARINSKDRYGTRLGHTASTTMEVFRTFKLGSALQVLPSLGSYMEWAGHDDESGVEALQTGGTTVFGTFSLRAYWKNWMLTANYQKALGWNIGDEMTATDYRVVTGLSYFLNH